MLFTTTFLRKCSTLKNETAQKNAPFPIFWVRRARNTKERRTEARARESETRQRRTMAKDLWKDAEHQLKELDMDLEDEGGNNPWDAAAGQEVRHRRPEAFFFFSPPPPRNCSLTTGFHFLSSF